MPTNQKFDKYLARRVRYAPFIQDKPSDRLRVIITIPVCNEPDVIPTLKSIYSDSPDHDRFETLVIINHSENAVEAVKEQNRTTSSELVAWRAQRGIRNLHLIELYDVPDRTAGVGHARKAVMDEGLIRLIQTGSNKGIIACTDGDTVVEEGYVRSLLLLAEGVEEAGLGFSFAFEHELEDIPDWQRIAIMRYELHLRYFRRCHEVMGHPHGTFTVGSAMACQISGYAEQGGMNERKAGEDFYFLQKFAKANRLVYHPDICVFPSARASDRVPFGTGKAVEDYRRTGVLDTYAFKAVLEVRDWIGQVFSWYRGDTVMEDINVSFKPYLEAINWQEHLKACLEHSTDVKSFSQHFFTWFDAFKVMKSLHWLRDNKKLHNQDVVSAINELRDWYVQRNFSDIEEALMEVRREDREVHPC